MKRTTHLVLGAACAAPIAISREPAQAAGCFLVGAMGGLWPDFLDLHSDFRGALKHRGVSHSVPFNAVCVLFAWYLIKALSQVSDPRWALDPDLVMPLTASFAIGIASHLVGDACTHAGVRPGLPLTNWRLRLLPRPFRGTTDGKIDRLVRTAATVALLGSVIWYVTERS